MVYAFPPHIHELTSPSTPRLTSGIIGAATLPLQGAWQGLRKQFAGRPDLALRHPREEISRADAKAVTDEEKKKLLKRFEELTQSDALRERKDRRSESERQLRERLETEANKRVVQESGKAKRDGSDADDEGGDKEMDDDARSEILWDESGASGPGGLSDEQRGEVESGVKAEERGEKKDDQSDAKTHEDKEAQKA